MIQQTNNISYPLALAWRNSVPAKGITVLAGDIGGTKTNLAIYKATAEGVTLLAEKRYASESYNSCLLVLQQFLQESGQPLPDRICLGVAGPVLDGKVELTNLSWSIDSQELLTELKVSRVALLNDLETTSYGLAGLQADDFITIYQPQQPSKGNMAILAPGTGLGEAGLYWDGKQYHPFPTEGGHCDFAPRTELDVELYWYLQKQYGIVSWEKLAAGPGIVDIYTFLRDVKQMEEPAWLTAELQSGKDPSAVISNAGVAQKEAICIYTMNLFVHYIARESSNLVLKIKATGGLLLGGGIPPKIAPLLAQPNFYEDFMNCDRMQHLLANVPIRIIKNDKTSLIGAAYYGAYGID